MKKILFAYRPSVAAIIVNDRHEFLLVRLTDAHRLYPWDFVKGGRDEGESREQALLREIREELGPEFKVSILKESEWRHVYDWNKETQEKKGFIGQARISFWVKHLSGDFILDPKELAGARWVPGDQMPETLKKSQFSPLAIQMILAEWEKVRTMYC